MEYEAVIGLEVHTQLRTETKAFCGCPTTFGAEPNTQTCPVCLGLPGVLPVLNRRMVEFAIKTALAFHSDVQSVSVFARKNYFYPDLPKGYQISQYDRPIAKGGYLEIPVRGNKEGTKRVRLERIHMEEDAGKSIHEGMPGTENATYVDLNRAGVPLLEIVSRPDMETPEEAGAYLRSLRSIVRYLGVCDGNMQEGSLRCDANVSIRPRGSDSLGTKVEVKNMNSFRAVEAALRYEIDRQKEALESGERIVQETRLWDENKGITFPMRSKEEAHDYRYFPEPDLIPVVIEEAWIEKIRASLPELPDAKAKRFIDAFQLPPYDAGVLVSSKALADFFEEAVSLYKKPKVVSNWVMGELLRYLNEDSKEIEQSLVKPKHLVALLKLIEEGTISGKMAKEVFKEVYKTGNAPARIVQEKGFQQISDESALGTVIDKVLGENPEKVQQYKAGRERLFGFFMGEVMKQTRGQANPQKVNALLKTKLSS